MKKQILFLFLVLIFSVSAKDFNIGKAEVSYEIEKNGVVKVEERITYNLLCREGEVFKELYIQKPPELIISNPTGYCEGASCKFRVDEPQKSVSGDRELILALDNSKKGSCGIKDGKETPAVVTAVFNYEVKKAIKVYPDTSQFFYKVWGEEWSKQAPLKVKIIMPEGEGKAQFFIHNNVETAVKEYGNSIVLEAMQPPNTFLEINLLMPKEWIDEKSPDIIYDPNYTKEDIIRIEEESKKKVEEAEQLLQLIFFADLLAYAIIAFSPLILCAYAYYKYGKEYSPEEVGYSANIEYDPPNPRTSPAEAHLIENGGIEIGNAFLGTILDLADKNHIGIEERGEEIYLVKKEASSSSPLKPHEEKAKRIIDEAIQATSGAINEISKALAKKAQELEEWQRLVKESANVENLIDLKGYNLFKSKYMLLLSLLVIYAFLNMPLLFILQSNFGYTSAINLFKAAVPFLIIFSFIYAFVAGVSLSLFAYEKLKMILGRWTKEGRLLNLRWGNFKKYLSEYTHIKEHPPMSIIIWDRMLAYATAFGIADRTAEAMQLYLKENPAVEERFRLEAESYAGKSAFYKMLKKPMMVSKLKALSTNLSRAHGARSIRVGKGSYVGVRGVGGHGGGFGGGGGGAR
ncbi:MAG: DUF2207 domain-containing protein [Candidatus Anstonellales archaeon]